MTISQKAVKVVSILQSLDTLIKNDALHMNQNLVAEHLEELASDDFTAVFNSRWDLRGWLEDVTRKIAESRMQA